MKARIEQDELNSIIKRLKYSMPKLGTQENPRYYTKLDLEISLSLEYDIKEDIIILSLGENEASMPSDNLKLLLELLQDMQRTIDYYKAERWNNAI